ncbi:MAG: hypothetical protein ACKVU0_09055 [Saprospiraceae bacterium]
MKNTIWMRYLLFLFVFTGFSCGEAAPPESRGDKLAKSLCRCTDQLLSLNKQAQTASDSLAFRNIATEFEKVRKCVSSLGLKPEDRAGLELSLSTHCPPLAEQQDLLSELLGQ